MAINDDDEVITPSDREKWTKTMVDEIELIKDEIVSDWEEKCWGRVQHLFASPYASVSYLETQPQTRCSWHFHNQRVNYFRVISGIIVVEQHVLSPTFQAAQVERMVLGPGYSMAVPCNKLHRFRVVEGGSLIEIYWPNPDKKHSVVKLEDIHRFDVGGLDVDQSNLQDILTDWHNHNG